MATITKTTQKEITWAEIAAAREAGTLDKLLAERNVIRFTLLDGTETAVAVEKVEPGRAWIGFVDAVAKRPMYERIEPPVTWEASDTRRWLNGEFIKLLPEDLRAIITPRTIRQTVKGTKLETTDLLWLHSITELFGRQDYAAGDDPTEEQLPIYQTERDRVKMLDGQTYPHFTRSVNAGTSTIFCLVYTDGTPGNSNADSSWAVPPGFWI